MQLCSTNSLIEYDLGKRYISPILKKKKKKTPPVPDANLSHHIALWAEAPSATNINRRFASSAKVISCTTFPTNHADDTGLDGSLKWDTFVSLRPFIRCKQILIYYSLLPFETFSPTACTPRAEYVNKTFPSLLHTAAAAGLSSTKFSLSFHPDSVLRWRLEWGGKGVW